MESGVFYHTNQALTLVSSSTSSYDAKVESRMNIILPVHQLTDQIVLENFVRIEIDFE